MGYLINGVEHTDYMLSFTVPYNSLRDVSEDLFALGLSHHIKRLHYKGDVKIYMRDDRLRKWMECIAIVPVAVEYLSNEEKAKEIQKPFTTQPHLKEPDSIISWDRIKKYL